MRMKMRAEIGFSGKFEDVLEIARILTELTEKEEVEDFNLYRVMEVEK